MSSIDLETITCTRCNYTQDFKVYHSINVSVDPKLKPLLLSGEPFTFVCEKCKYHALVPYDIMYHDMDNQCIIQLSYDLNENKRSNIRKAVSLFVNLGYKIRLVSNCYELIEKIAIFDEGLDDIFVEIVKINLMEIYQKHGIKFEMYFDGMMGDTLEYRISLQNQLYKIQVPMDKVQKLIHEIPDEKDIIEDFKKYVENYVIKNQIIFDLPKI
jgi:hypothetical protein